MNKTKLVLLLIGTTILGWLTSFINSFITVQCTEVSMLTVRDPMGPIWYYKQLANFCAFGNGLVIIVGLFLIGMIWFLAYRKSFFQALKEN